MKKFLILIFTLFIFINNVSAQTFQDCISAYPVCQNTINQNTNFSGIGTINELNATNQGCLTTGENNSVWYIINVANAGVFTFTITPNSSADYDFALWDITDKSCADIANGLQPIRCNYASLANSSPGGLTGLNTISASASLGAGGPSFCSAVNTLASKTYLLLVNNNSLSNSGYVLNFNGTASVNDNLPPTIKADTLQDGCGNPNFIKILMNENIKCNSLSANGSDFILTPPNATITSAVSSSCGSGSNFTNLFTLNFSNPLPPGNYTLQIVNGSDANTLIDNCNNIIPINTSRSFVVNPPVGMTVQTQPGCAGQSNGAITVTGQNGTPPYEYKLNLGTYSANNVFSNLGVGNYTITIKDANGCTQSSVVNLPSSSAINISNIVIQNPPCFGQTNGSITTTASGGNPPLEYTVNTNPYQLSNVINNLGPGNYILKVKDASGCIKDSVVFLSAPGQISFSNLLALPSYCNQGNGSINTSAFGGTSPYQFKLNAGTYQATGVFSNLNSGNYTVTVKDANNCTLSTVVNIALFNKPIINSVNIILPSCSNNSGQITVNASGGTAPLSYSKNGVNFIAGNVFANLASGSYTITVKDANNCTATSIVNLSSPGNLHFTNAVVVQPNCVTLGSINVQGQGGVSPYTFSLNANPYSANSNFTNLAGGSYTIHLKDATNCIHDTIINLIIPVAPTFTNVVKTNPTCSFPNSGIINVTVSGGTPAYQYKLNAGAYGAVFNWSNLVQGVYTITVKDANQCTVTSTVVLNQNNTLSFSQFTKTNIGCFGTPLGSINAIVANGNPAYSFSLNGGASQANGNYLISNAGTYTIVATDASGCTISSIVNITSSGTVLMNSLNFTNSPCIAPPTGTITVSGTVSNPPISYSVLPGGGTNTSGNFSNLGPGTYTVYVKDATNCSVSSIVVLAPAPLLYYSNCVVVKPPCFGGVGSISVTGAGGTPPYQYRINAGLYGNVSTWNNLVAGTYTIRFRDANGCHRDTVINLIQPPEIHFNGTLVSNSSCGVQPTGSITLNATGGTPPFQYKLNAGLYSNNNVFNLLGAGTYTLSVKDSNNCIKDTIITILANGNFLITSVVKVKPSCFGGTNGSMTINVSGGISPYEYKKNVGAFQGSNVFTNLTAGTYTITAKDVSGCTSTSIVVITQPTILAMPTVTKTNPTCFGSTNGIITFTGSGGTIPYNYALNAGAYSATNTFNNLAAGTYTLHLKDANNCTKDSIIQLQNPAAISFTNLQVINAGCSNIYGSISYGASGGTSPYTFSKNGINYVATGNFTNLTLGTYTIYIKDANNCTNSSVVNITNSNAITISNINFTPVICNGTNTGSIAISALTNNPPMSYQLNGGTPQASNTFSNLIAGIYTIHVQDASNCFKDSIIQIQNSNPININAVVLVSPLCFGNNNGSVQLNASGGIGNLTYQKNNAAFVATNLFSNLLSNTYTFTVKDSLGCEVDTVINLTQPAQISVWSSTIAQPYCNVSTDGSITVNVTGGIPPYLYSINTSLYTTSNVFSNLVQGSYTVHIKDINNCQLDTVINLVSNNNIYFNNVVIQNVSCVGGNNASISLNTVGGTAPYLYTINSIPNGNSGTFSNLGSGFYNIVVTDNQGCTHDTLLLIQQPPNSILANLLNATPNLCKGDSAGSLTLTASGGSAPYEYSINGTSYQVSPTFSFLPAGNFLCFAKDANGCIDDTLLQVLEPDTSVQLLVLNIVQASCIGVNDASIAVTAQYGFKPYTYFLNGVAQGTDTFYKFLAPGDYTIEVFDSIGCKSTGKYNIPEPTIRPYIYIDSLQNEFCIGDKKGFISWYAQSPYPPYMYSFDGVGIGAINFANNLGNGSYQIFVTDSRGCVADTTIAILSDHEVEAEVATYAATCLGSGTDGAAKAIVLKGDSPFDFTWSVSPIKTDSISDVKYGKYILYVSDINDCKDTVQFEIAYDPCCTFFLPNAFSPNGDGQNDDLKMFTTGQITFEKIMIFNRWGQKVFETKDVNTFWDGNYLNEKCEIGTYFFRATYKCSINPEREVLQGDITLIR